MDEVSEACEFYGPAKEATVKIGKNSKKKRLTEMKNGPETFSHDSWARDDIFNEQWKMIETKLMSLTSDIFQKYVDKLYDFILRYSSESPIQLKDGNNQVGFNCGLLPTAMIALDSKMTQVRIINELSKRIEENDSQIKTIKLNSYNCVNMNNLFQTFFNSLLSDSICKKNNIDKSKWKNMSFDEIFTLWHNSVKSSDNSEYRAELVIFVFDFENVNKQILINLILILKEYVKDVSIIFVFLVYNQLNSSIQNFLPAQATDNLMIEDISPFYELKFIPQLLKEFIVDSNIQFKIHPNLIKEIHFYFTNYEFSFSNFLIFLKSLCFDYFYNNPVSVICKTSDLRKTLQSNERLLNIMKNSLPFSEHEMKDNEYVDFLITKYIDLLKKHKDFSLNLQMIIDFQMFSRCRVNSFLSLYCEMITEPNYNYKDFLGVLLNLDENVWNAACKKFISKYKQNTKTELFNKFVWFQEKLTEILRKDREEEDTLLNSAKKLGLDCDVKIVKNKLRNVHSRSEWKQSLAPKLNNKQLTPFDELKKNLIDSIQEILQRSSPAHDRLLIDSIFYNKIDFIRKHHFISVRDDLKHKLNQSSSNQSLKNIYPNSLILYQLYKDSSPVVNLHDWFQQFCEEKNLGKTDFTKSELIVHFSSTLSDFDYIGLLQASKYKADYMNKLVWF